MYDKTEKPIPLCEHMHHEVVLIYDCCMPSIYTVATRISVQFGTALLGKADG